MILNVICDGAEISFDFTKNPQCGKGFQFSEHDRWDKIILQYGTGSAEIKSVT